MLVQLKKCSTRAREVLDVDPGPAVDVGRVLVRQDGDAHAGDRLTGHVDTERVPGTGKPVQGRSRQLPWIIPRSGSRQPRRGTDVGIRSRLFRGGPGPGPFLSGPGRVKSQGPLP